MASNKHLGLFFTSAAAVSGLYLLYRKFSDDARANPKQYTHRKSSVYTHRKTFYEFTPAEKENIARKYTEDNQSVDSLAKEFGTTFLTLRRILEDQKCDIRDHATAVALRRILTDEQKESIRARWKDDIGHPTLKSLSDATGVHVRVITKFLVEEGLYEVKTKETELTDEDKRKLVAAKEAANRDGKKLILWKLGKELNLDHRDVGDSVLLRFFAERGLNRDRDYTGTLDVDQQDRILSYFKGGEQTVSLTDICEREGVERTQLRNFLFSQNIIPKKSSAFLKVELDEGQKALMISLLEKGKTNREIAEIMGLSVKIITPLIAEYRASQGRTVSRSSESRLALRDRLELRNQDIVDFIMAERDKTPPTSYDKIVEKLRTEKGISSGYRYGTVRRIHLQELSKRK